MLRPNDVVIDEHGVRYECVAVRIYRGRYRSSEFDFRLPGRQGMIFTLRYPELKRRFGVPRAERKRGR